MPALAAHSTLCFFAAVLPRVAHRVPLLVTLAFVAAGFVVLGLYIDLLIRDPGIVHTGVSGSDGRLLVRCPWRARTSRPS